MTSTSHAKTPNSPVIVLLAAGEGRRFGGAKQLAIIHGEPMVHRVARIAAATGAPLVVVTGARADAVKAALGDIDLRAVHCATWASGMGDSLATGAKAVQQHFPAASAVLLCLADQPLLETDMLLRLLHRHREVPGKILATGHGQTLGPPTLFPRDCLDALTRLSGVTGAKAILQQASARVEKTLSTAGIDVDTPDAMARVLAHLAARNTP